MQIPFVQCNVLLIRKLSRTDPGAGFRTVWPNSAHKFGAHVLKSYFFLLVSFMPSA